MKIKYNSPEIEITESPDVVTTSPETERIPVAASENIGAYEF